MPEKREEIIALKMSQSSSSSLSSGNAAPDFIISDDILSVLPADPYDQLDLARKITSLAISSRVSNLESELELLRQKVSEKDRVIFDLEEKVSMIERKHHENEHRFQTVLDENVKLSKERDLLAISSKKLSRDLAKLSSMTNKGKEIVDDLKKTKWSNESTEIFIDLCIKESKKKGPTDKWCWRRLCPEFKSLSNINYSTAVLKNRYDNLKQKWQLWNKLKSCDTEFGWNSTRGTIDASDEWWSARIEENPHYKKFRYAPLLFVDKLDMLYGGRVATGENKLSTRMPSFHTREDLQHNCDTPFFGEDCTQQSPPYISLDDGRTSVPDDDQISVPESTPKSRKRKQLDMKVETNLRLDKCIEVIQSHFEKKYSNNVDKIYGDAMSSLFALNLGDEDDYLLYFGIKSFESEAQRHLFVRTPEHKRLGYLRAVYASRTSGNKNQ